MSPQAREALDYYRRQYVNLSKDIRHSEIGKKFRLGYGMVLWSIRAGEFFKTLEKGTKTKE